MISLIGFISTGCLAAVYVCIKIRKVKPKKTKKFHEIVSPYQIYLYIELNI